MVSKEVDAERLRKNFARVNIVIKVFLLYV